ncbi:MAG: hypothetical protein JW981_01550 [Anaerolineae bacterium]|nr:hypothetical protein [Anaerolineae bacterium]
MRRTIPQDGADKIVLYLRTYYSLLRTTDTVRIRTLEETHTATKSALHPDAGGMRPDMSAFIYSSLRLPRCILDVRRVILGQSDEVFKRRDYPDVETWQRLRAPARRRRYFFDGDETMGAYIASISDVDDIVPTLTAFQIEWNKMHTLISLQAGLVERIKEWAKSCSLDLSLEEELCATLRLSSDDWERLRSIWADDLPQLLRRVATRRKRMTVRLLSGSHIEYRRATQRWWNRVNREVQFDLSESPTYFVSSNTHSLVNMLTGFAQQHEKRLMDYLASGAVPDLQNEAERIRRRQVPTSWSNFLYYLLKKYMRTPEGADLSAARDVYEAEHGVTRIASQHTFDLSVQVIELAKLVPDHVDVRLCDLPLENLRDSNAIILNIDYPLGFAAYHLLTRIAVNVGDLRGAYIIGKAATLNGRIGDVLVPNVVYDEHSKNTYLFGNVFTAKDVSPYLVHGDVLDNQRALTVRGTFLQNQTYMESYLDLGYTDVEMEAGPYLSALYEFIRPRRYPMDELVNLYPVPFEIGMLHYASDTPMSKAKNLGARNLSYYGMDPTYAATVAVLRRILTLETKRSSKSSHL